MISVKDFWKWFEENSAKFFFLNQIENEEEKEKILDDFLEHLHQYSDKLFFEIGGHPDETQELIITAEGNLDYFPKVEELVKQAPKLKDWNIIAFKPPKEFGFITHYNNIKLNPQEMWFLSLESSNASELIELKIFIRDFDNQQADDYLFATAIVLDNLLGEKLHAKNITHLEIAEAPDNPEGHDLTKLSELPEFIQWIKEQS